MERKIVLGLDIGVGSVGWGLIDKDTGEIIDKGVRLFSESDPETNKSRRGFRSTRRLIRRKEFRLYRARRVLLQAGIINDMSFEPFDNPYEIRVKGLKEKLNNDELATAILHLIKRNGFRYELVDADEECGNRNIKEDYLCEHQLNVLRDTGSVRGINNKYHFDLYKKEFEKLLEVQEICGDTKEKLLDIFEKRRDFSEGPGSANSPSKYGRYLYLNAEPINLIDKMRGKCSVYPDEVRAPKCCPSSEMFNLLNDLNNLKVKGNKISLDKIDDIIQKHILAKGKITPKKLADELGTNLDAIEGFRVNAKGEPLLTELTSIVKMNKATKAAFLSDVNTDDFEPLDGIFEVLTQEKSVEYRKKELRNLNIGWLNENYIDCLANIKGVSGYHSLSLKAIRELSEEMIETGKNSQQIIVTKERDREAFKELKLPKDLVISPVAAKSINQSYKIIKAITKKYGTLESVVIEMTRSKNGKEEKDNITKSLERREKEKNEIVGLISNKVVDPSDDLIKKVLMYKEQDGKSPYSGKTIDLDFLITHPGAFEIDHIIPYSISLDNKQSNKVLVYASENQYKAQRTPYQTFSSGKPSDWWTYEQYEAYVLGTFGKNNKAKARWLLFKDDINKQDVRNDFIDRNLADTRYVTREVMNHLKYYYNYHKIDTKVFVVNGATTNLVRYLGNLPKQRHLHYHHAVDALIIASFRKSTYMSKCMTYGNDIVDSETGIVYSKMKLEELFGDVLNTVVKQLQNLKEISDFKYSYKIDTKPNRNISDSTIYGTIIGDDGELHVVKKIKDIYDKEITSLLKMFNDPDKRNNLLLYKYDKPTFNHMLKIIDHYSSEKGNPFALYKNENNDFVRKITKKGKGPIIKSLRYIEDKVGVHLDLSKSYKKTGNGVESRTTCIKVQLSPYRMDLYRNDEGKYKFVTIRYAHVLRKNDKFIISPSLYEKLKEAKGIDNTYLFVCSFHRDELIKREFVDKDTLIERFKVVNNDKTNSIELSYFGCDTTKKNSTGDYKSYQYMQTIGKNVTCITKLSTDILGNIYEVKNERLKLEWDY